jgi:hypothetical protein
MVQPPICDGRIAPKQAQSGLRPFQRLTLTAVVNRHSNVSAAAAATWTVPRKAKPRATDSSDTGTTVPTKPVNPLGTPNCSSDRRVRIGELILLTPATAKVAAKHSLTSTSAITIAFNS